MYAEYQKLLNGWQEYQHPVSLRRNTLRIGIATGPAYSGLVGAPEERRSKLIGSEVNLAWHLCDDVKAVGGGIAICTHTPRNYSVMTHFPSHSLEPLAEKVGSRACCQNTLRRKRVRRRGYGATMSSNYNSRAPRTRDNAGRRKTYSHPQAPVYRATPRS